MGSLVSNIHSGYPHHIAAVMFFLYTNRCIILCYGLCSAYLKSCFLCFIRPTSVHSVMHRYGLQERLFHCKYLVIYYPIELIDTVSLDV